MSAMAINIQRCALLIATLLVIAKVFTSCGVHNGSIGKPNQQTPKLPATNEMIEINLCTSENGDIENLSRADLAALVPAKNCTYPPRRGGRMKRSCYMKVGVVSTRVRYYCCSTGANSSHYLSYDKRKAVVTCQCWFHGNERYPARHCYLMHREELALG